VNFRIVLAVILLAGSTLAQKPAAPGPEVKKLDFFVGTWTGEGNIPPGPWGAGGKYSITHKNEWMTGNLFLLCRSDSRMPADLGGDSESIGFAGYDTDKKVYTVTGFDGHGEQGVELGSLNGDTWTWTGSEKLPDGHVIQHRETNKMLSPTSYRAIFEVSNDGTNWTVMMDSTVTKK
jgi:Protein of unknown function (DUF1579)